MKKKAPRAESFREWLFEKLLGTWYAKCAIADSEIDRVAKKIGVDPELLLEVRAQARIERHERGFPSPHLRHTKPAAGEAHRRLYQYHLPMAEVVRKAWTVECEFRQVTGPVLLRSLIHSYLLGTREPTPLAAWYYQGVRHPSGGPERHKHYERSTIPHGAKRALTRRAVAQGTIPMNVVRALVLEVLAGQHRQIRFVETSMMYDDESRYLVPS